jgi:trigger factor
MKVTTERLEDCQINVFVELDAAEVDKKLRQTARKISRNFNVPGYRRGKAPYHAVVRIFGREAVQQETMEEFGNGWYEQALKEIEYEPYEVGRLEEVEWEPFRMIIRLPIQPEAELGDYRSVRVDYEAEEVTEEQIEERLAGYQQEYAQWVPVERPAAIGDQIVIDLEGKVGDELIMHNEDFEMILQADVSYPLPGFHEEVVGVSPGEEKTFTLTVPEDDDDEDIAGEEASITVRVHTIKEEDLPPLDDELAMMVGDYETLDDLKASLREDMETEASQKAESEYLDKVLEAMIEAADKIEYPSQAIDRESEMALDQMERSLASSGIQLDTYLGMMNKTREMYKQELRPASEERLKKRLVLGEVAKREKLTVEDDEIDAEIDRLCEMMGEQGEQMREVLESPGGRLSVADDLLVTRVQERVVEIAKGEAPPLEEEEEEEIEGEEEPQGEGPVAEDAGEEEPQEAQEELADESATEEPAEASVEEDETEAAEESESKESD